MPLPKSLQRTPVRRTSSSTSTGLSRRKRCPVCNHLDPRDHPSSIYPDEVDESRRVSLSLIIDAYDLARNRAITDRGCRFCNVLAQALDAFMENWRGVRAKINVDIEEKRPIKVSIDGDRWQGTLVEIYAASSSRAPWPTLGTAHHVPNNAGSDDTFNFIRRCISGCLANPKHSACRPTDSASISAPKRLVDVGRVSSPIRLIDTQGKAFQYAALSHCWGNSPQLTTTKSNWAKLAVNISFEKLPALFQDAVIITRQLGLRYIWIDSLCIIQDSMRDWETESSKMGSIYQNAYITISATSAGDGSARCLKDRQKPVKIQYQNTAKKEFWLRARKTLEQHPIPGTDGSPAKPIGPLTSRAWALQEHVLSTRILHYTATELLFECRASYRCECSPERKSWPTTPALIPKAIASKNPGAVFQAWQQIVGQYSSRSLTMSGDKLTAISGVASKIRKCTHSAYLAGLWKDNLASDLLWSSEPTDASALTHAVQPVWRAPTFSWASLDISVKYTVLDDDERKVFTPTVTLLADNIKTKGLNPLGVLTDASITLRGPTSPATLISNNTHGNWTYTLLLKGTSSIDIIPDSHLVQAELQTKDGNQRITVKRMRPGAVMKSFTAPVLCINVARYDNVVAGLILGLVQEFPTTWERVGTFAAGTEAMQSTEEKEVILV